MAGKLKPIDRRRARVRRALKKRNNDFPRLSVFRSHQNIYAQVIDADAKVVTSASTLEPEVRKQVGNGATVSAAALIGKRIADKAREKGVEAVSFDRSGFKYHGRVKALADAAREAGLKF